MPSVEEAELAFERGDYLAVRELCTRLSRSDDPTTRRRASELLRRVSVDPFQVGVLLACLALFGIIVYVYVL